MPNPITVFTKPWRTEMADLGAMLRDLGVDGLELPVRDGYPVNPDNVATALPQAVKTLARFGQRIYSVAATPAPAIIQACGEAGVPIIRVCEHIDMKRGYFASVAAIQAQYREAVPLLERHGVTIGLQNHCNFDIGSAVGVMHAIGEFDPKHVGAVLDVAHCGLDGEPEEMAIDIVWSHLCMVNLKNAFRRRVNGPEAAEAEWKIHWTTGPHGFASWRKTLRALGARGYAGPYCLCAEYSNPKGGDHVGDDVLPLIRQDIEYAKSLMAALQA